MLQVTNKAFAKLEEWKQKNKSYGILLGVSVNGCSGYSYTFDPIYKVLKLDSIYRNGSILYISEMAKSILANDAELDLVTEFLVEKLVITNDKVNSVCGCGESFYF